MLRLQLVLCRIKLSHGDQTRVRLLITVHHLKLFYLCLAVPNTQNFATLMILEAIALAFFGFIPLGELKYNAKFNSNVRLTEIASLFSPWSRNHSWGYQLRDSPSQCFKKIPCSTPSEMAHYSSMPLGNRFWNNIYLTKLANRSPKQALMLQSTPVIVSESEQQQRQPRQNYPPG